MRVVRPLLLLAACVATLLVADPAAAQFTIGGDPRVNPGDFRITTFTTGLNFPNGLAQLSDGSILVATSNPSGSFFNSTGTLLRFTDTNDDGIADASGQVVYSDPVGVLVALKALGNLVYVTSAASGSERITILRMNNGPASPYTRVGTLSFAFPADWEHKSYALAVRPAPGGPANTYELYFNIGSSANFGQSAATVGLSGLLTGTLQGGSIYRVIVTDTGSGATVSSLTRIAAGLRNAAGMDFHAVTGDFYFEENGIDGLQDRNEPLSVDELNRIVAADLGRIVPDFGFPNDYIEYRTGRRVGSGGVQPIATFQPIPMPNGSESEGPSGIVFAPPSFPPYVNNGIFIGFHGKFADPPSTNEENPLVFWDRGTGQYFHFIENHQLGHPDQLLSTEDSLFIADMSSDGQVNTGGTGVIYQIKRRAASSPPIIPSITSPSEGATVSGTVTVGMSETGGTGTITWTLRLDSAATPLFTASTTGSTASFNWDTSGVTPGAHTLTLTVQDGAGRTGTATRNIIVGGGGTLRVAITQPGADGATVSGTTWFVLWVEGAAAGTKTYTLSVNGTTVASTTDASSGPISMAWDTRQVGDGSTTVIATARDSGGNSGSAPRIVNVSNGQSLTASITSPAEGATVTGTVPISMSESGGTGTITWTLRLDSGTTPIFTTSGTGTTASFNWNTAGVAAGAHTLRLTVQDGAGRTATATRNVNVSQGVPLPGAFFTSPAEGATVSGVVTVGMGRESTTGTVTWTLRIDGVQVFTATNSATSATFNWDTTAFSNGAHTLSLTVDAGGGSSSSATRNVTVGTPALTASITSPAEGATVSGPVSIGMSQTGGTGTITWTLRLDGGATPIFTTSNTGSTAAFTWETSGVAPGPHRLDLTVQDGGGRTATATRNVTVQQGGTIRVFITQPGTDGTTVSGTVWFTIWLENAAAGARNLTLSIDGVAVATTSTTSNGPISMPWNSAGASGGTHTATVSVRDAANNTGSANRTVVIAGGPGPLIASFTSPAQGASVSGTTTIGMSATNASGAPVSFTLTVDGTQIFTTSGSAATASFSWNANSVANGPHTLGLTVSDGAGRTATATRNVTVTDPPALAVAFTSPAEGATVSGAVTVAATATGGSGTLTWTVRLDDTTTIFTTSGTASGISFSWDTRTVADGGHRLSVTVQDGLGRSAAASRLVTVQQPPPSTIRVFITQPASDGATVGGTTWFTIWIENAATGTKTYTLSVDGTPVATTNTSSNGPVSIPWTTNGTSNGSHTVTIGVSDAAGGRGSANRIVNVAN